MPISLQTLEDEKILIATIVGEATLGELEESLDKINIAGMLSWRKLLDLRHGEVVLDNDEVMRLAARTSAYAGEGTLGAIALVVPRDNRQRAASHFLYLTQGKRRAQIFHTMEDARRWLDRIAAQP